ncbi:Bacterial Ig-like domain (group 2) [compost metagenome]
MKKTYLIPAIAALIGVSAAGCQSVAPVSTAIETMHPSAGEPQAFGNVSVRIKWPQAVQAIPLQTKSIVLSIYRKGQLVGTETIVRQDGQGLASKVMRLPAGEGYLMEAMAYAVEAPQAHHTAIALGSSSLFEVGSNVLTPVPIALEATAIIGFEMGYNVGGLGQLVPVYIDKERFYHPLSASDTVEVYFGTAKSPEVRRMAEDKSGYHFWVKVPQQVRGNQDVRVFVNGAESSYSETFTVLDRLAAKATSISLLVGESDMPGDDLYGAAGTNRYWLNDDIYYPVVTWKSSDPSVAFVTQRGAVYALKAGQATITAMAGTLETTIPVTVQAGIGSTDLTVTLPSDPSGGVTIPVDLPAQGGNTSGPIVP